MGKEWLLMWLWIGIALNVPCLFWWLLTRKTPPTELDRLRAEKRRLYLERVRLENAAKEQANG